MYLLLRAQMYHVETSFDLNLQIKENLQNLQNFKNRKTYEFLFSDNKKISADHTRQSYPEKHCELPQRR